MLKRWFQSSAAKAAVYSGAWALVVSLLVAALAAREIADYELKLFDQNLEHLSEVQAAGLRFADGVWIQPRGVILPDSGHSTIPNFALLDQTKVLFGTNVPGQVISTRNRTETLDIDQVPFRIFTEKVVSPQGQFTAKLWADLRPLNAGVQRAGWILTLCALGFGLLAALGVGLLVRRQLAPFDLLQRQIRLNRNSLSMRNIDVLTQMPEAARLARAYNNVLVKLNDNVADLDRFAARCAHELRTPLTSLRLMLENQLVSGQSGQVHLEQQLETVDRLTLLVNRLLRLARGSGLGKLEALDLQVPVDAALSEIQPLLEDHHWQVVNQLAPQTKVLADAGAILQVLVDLLENCVRHNADGGTITLSSVTGKDKTVLLVANAGQALPHQSQASTHKGFGLGKPIIERLVREMGGNVAWQSEASGTQVRVTLTTAL